MRTSFHAMAAALCCLSAGPVVAAPGAVEFFPAPGNGPKPFSASVRVGDTVYVSGAIGLAKDGTLPSDFSAQATNAMDAVAGEFKLAGATMDDVFKCDVALSDMKNWPAFNVVYVKYFKPGHLPVRMVTGASSLAKSAAVELECQAHAQAG